MTHCQLVSKNNLQSVKITAHGFFQISVAVDRIQRFLLSEELDETSVTHDPTVGKLCYH